MKFTRILKTLAIAAWALVPALPALAQTVQIYQLPNQPLPSLQQSMQSNQQQVVVNTSGPDPHLAHGWDRKTSHTECGGLRKDGSPQPACSMKPADYMGPALGTCPEGTEFDIGLWSCWSCDKSKGFTRTAAAVDTDRACARPATPAEAGNKPRFARATFLGKLCPKGDDQFNDAFFDTIRGGECWSCPRGYEMNVLVHVEAPNKCTRPAREQFSFAELSFRTTDPVHCRNRDDGADRGQLVFYDMYDYGGKGPGCWKCPVGFDRTVGPPVYASNACHRVITADDKPATVRSVGKCEAGAIQDPRNGGECWKCPATYDRVLLHAINAADACETTPTTVFSKAKYEAALTCPGDQVFDFIKVDNADLSRLKQAGRAAPNVQAAANGGTCWKCPPEHKRTVKAVTDTYACEGGKTEWYSAPYQEPGLFGLAGAEQVVEEILTKDGKLVDDAIREIVKQCAASNTPEAQACRTNPNKEIAEAWKEIAATPGESGVLITMVFGRIALAATEGSAPLPQDVRPATAADRRLLASFADYVQKKRIYVSLEALKAFDAWRKADEAAKQRARQESAKQGIPYREDGAPPPDWHQIVEDGMLSTFAGVGVAAGGATIGIMTNPVLYNKVFPHAGKTLGKILARNSNKEFVAEFGKRSLGMGKKFAQKVTSESLKRGASSALKVMKAAGPAFVVTVLVEVAVELAINFDEYSRTDRPHLETMLANAKQPVDLRRDLLTEERAGIVNGYWSMALSGNTAASPAVAARIKAAAESMMPAPAVWTQLQGQAVDAGAGGNALWVIGTNQVPGGYGLHRWDGKAFVPASGGAVRIDVGPDGKPWVVNNAGQIFRWTGTAWELKPGENAQDIGVGANGDVWYIGGEKAEGGYRIYRWNPAIAAANKWEQKGPLASAMRIDVDPNGNAWIVNNANNIFRWNGATWVQVPGKARDIGIGPNGAVFVVGDNNTVHKWEPDLNTWVMRDGLLNEITVGPNGVPVGVNASKQIWLGYQ